MKVPVTLVFMDDTVTTTFADEDAAIHVGMTQFFDAMESGNLVKSLTVSTEDRPDSYLHMETRAVKFGEGEHECSAD